MGVLTLLLRNDDNFETLPAEDMGNCIWSVSDSLDRARVLLAQLWEVCEAKAGQPPANPPPAQD